MLEHMAKLPKAKSPKALAGTAVGRFMRFGLLRGLRSVEIDPEDFRRHLAEKHGLWVPHFGRMKDAPLEKLDAIAERLIHDAQRLAMAQGAGFGLGGMITVIPDTGFLTVITLRLIQKLCLLYGFEENGTERRAQMWMAAATATGLDFSKDLAEKQMMEKLAPRLASRLAIRLGEESAEKWVGRLIPLASSAIGGALNYSFVKTWGRRVQKNLREKHLAERAAAATNVTALRPAIVR
jgi:EcsC protein family